MKEYILLIPNGIKKSIIEELRKEYYNYNIKFISLEDFIKRYTFSYDNKTIYYLMKEYNINYSTALVYLNNLCYISDKLDNDKMTKLKEIKSFLDNNKLLIYDNYFREYVKDKEIIVYGYDYITKYQMSVLDGLNYKVKDYDKKLNNINKIYAFDNITDEVIFVVNRICNLLKEGISINNIKIIATSEYTELVDRVFKLCNINTDIKKNNIYSIYEVKNVINNLDNLDIINNITNREVKEKVIDVINNYSFIDDKTLVKDLIIHDLKNTYLTNKEICIKNITLDSYISSDDYVFLMGYNKENIPRVYKDNEYFNDKERKLLSLDTSNELNVKEREKTINKIRSINNLTISYKEYDSFNIYSMSDLLSDVEIIKESNHDYENSYMLNKLLLSEKLDDLVNYNIYDNDIDILNHNNKIPYREYDNSYKTINKDKLYKYLNNKLVLAYTSFDNYNRCGFKYYMNNILKLNVIKDDFAIIIGNVCHYILSCIDKDDFDIEKYYNEYLKEVRSLNKKEEFFLENIKDELIFVIDTIKKQMTYMTFDKEMHEEAVYINKDKSIKVTFMGVIDKVLYKEEDGITYLAVVDYKTGSTDIKLDNMEYGIGMQLPIYLYLTSNMKFKNIDVVGFYLQKLFDNNLDNKKDYVLAKENNLRLEGYSTSNENSLAKFDNTYNDSKLIKSMKTTKEGSFTKFAKVLSEEEMNDLISKTKDKIEETTDKILNAEFNINPKVIDNKNVSCEYCDYADICHMKDKDIIYINRKKENDNE